MSVLDEGLSNLLHHLRGNYLLENLEARVGIEPTHKGFADLSLTTWVPRHPIENKTLARREGEKVMERETGFEPATSTLARSHSTAELLPLAGTY